MKTKTMGTARIAVVALLGLLVFSCKEINKQNAPVELIVTQTQTLHTIDVKSGAANCNQNIATVNVQSILLQPSSTADTRFDDVQLTQYQVTYQRTDGGTLIPQSFTQPMSQLITTGGGSTATTFLAFPPNAFTQAPFVALQPNNGGRDPETGHNYVQMDLILTVFGSTIAGDRVSGSVRIPLTFCYDCNGCS